MLPTEVGTIRVDGIKVLRRSIQNAGISFFQYTGNTYLTDLCETHEFLEDLEQAVVYEMMTSLKP